MIYIHTFKVAFGHKKREIRKIYDDFDKAQKQQRVLGGVLQAFESVENIAVNEHIKELVIDEVACIIDDMSTDAPGSPRNLEPGSSEWDVYKVTALNQIRELLESI